MWATLRDHLDVVWGFLVALAVVLVLTPAVGRVARGLGIVDEAPERRRRHVHAAPRAARASPARRSRARAGSRSSAASSSPRLPSSPSPVRTAGSCSAPRLRRQWGWRTTSAAFRGAGDSARTRA